MDDLARLLAHEEIRDLAYRYAVAIDRHDHDRLGTLPYEEPTWQAFSERER